MKGAAKIAAGAAVSIWLLLVAAGFKVLLDYGLTPGAQGQAPAHWPAASSLVRNPDGPTLIVALHPQCSCSRATLAELAAIVKQRPGVNQRSETMRAYALFVRPPGVAGGWERAELWRRAAQIPGITLVADDRGREAIRFGAATSGQTLLYDRAGVLRFSGGITAARGFYGDNAGARAMIALLDNRAEGSGHTAVYGCPLLGSGCGKK